MSNNLIFVVILSFIVACSSQEDKNQAEDWGVSPVDKIFKQTAKTYNIPYRFLVAVGYLESKLESDKGSALYGDHLKGLAMEETAFGISRESLNINNRDDANDLSVQIPPYGLWLSKALDNVKLPPNPETSVDKFTWIWEIAQRQRQGKLGRRNVQAIFALELIDLLNSGFSWQDPVTKQVVDFPRENPALKIEDFKQATPNLLKLVLHSAEINSAKMLPLVGTNQGIQKQTPFGIKVIHCPYTFSACLELQASQSISQTTNPEVPRLEAHYIIPQNNHFSEVPLQITLHENSVSNINDKGINTYSDNKVVIMLVGNSGRIVDGVRKNTNPMWLTKWQLQNMGELIVDICYRLTEAYPEQVNMTKCLSVGQGVTFQETTDKFHLGDVADFDPLIFSSYIDSPGGLAGETVFEFDDPKKVFEAENPIKIGLSYQLGVKYIELERLVRCPNEKTIWAPIANDDSFFQIRFSFEKKFRDYGPNKNGSQFFRAKVYDDLGNLIGWDTTAIFLKNYDKKAAMTPRACIEH